MEKSKNDYNLIAPWVIFILILIGGVVCYFFTTLDVYPINAYPINVDLRNPENLPAAYPNGNIQIDSVVKNRLDSLANSYDGKSWGYGIYGIAWIFHTYSDAVAFVNASRLGGYLKIGYDWTFGASHPYKVYLSAEMGYYYISGTVTDVDFRSSGGHIYTILQFNDNRIIIVLGSTDPEMPIVIGRTYNFTINRANDFLVSYCEIQMITKQKEACPHKLTENLEV